jgi:hypothetical protein
MAVRTKCYEIVFFVVPEESSGSNVVYLKVPQAARVLTAPGIAVQNSLPYLPYVLGSSLSLGRFMH